MNAHLETKSRADLILRLDPAIRYVAIIDNSNTVIDCKGQGTFSLPLSPERVLDFASIGPLLVMGSMSNKLESSCGKLAHVTGRFEKALVVIYQLLNFMVVVVTDPTMQTQQVQKIASSLMELEESAHASFSALRRDSL